MTKSKSKGPASAKPKSTAKTSPKTVVLFGADEFGKPRAARFVDADQALLAKAAEALHLRLVPVANLELDEIARKLPIGRLHANGEGLVPFVRGDLYCELVGVTVGNQQAPNDLKSSKGLPTNVDELAPGHLVLAHETLECGWWEAVVVDRKNDLVTLRYRDFPNYPPLIRHLSAVALICPTAK
ncbi:MAG: hypothetical protein K2Y71_15815 [Xanthobacteraceae bacterium]|nr:hypothetical protein [Xanthobacteraceae bacterium]